MTQPTDTNALRSKAENQRENLRYQGHGEPLTGLAIQAADELDRLRADLSEERHAHNKTQFDLAEARKERALIVAIVRDVVNSFQDEDGYELAGQVRIRLKQIERGEHLGGSDGDM